MKNQKAKKPNFTVPVNVPDNAHAHLSMSTPTIAIVGRPNVGKSALFNCLAARKIAIVHDQPGVTRDRLSAPLRNADFQALVVDTGGIGATVDDGFSAQVAAEADIAMAAADLILFVCDCREHLTPVDRDIAVRLHSSKVPVLLVLNKADTPKQELTLGEFASMGFAEYVFTSAAHGRGLEHLLGLLNEHLSKLGAEPAQEANSGEDEDVEPSVDDSAIRMAVVGRPNAGKSSLINAILRDKRTIVSEQAGTTRDAVDIPYTRGEVQYVLIDTAGMRPRSRRDTSVEVFSAMRSERAIRRSDVSLLVIDCAAGITHQDRRIAAEIAEEKKPCIVVLNKFDLFCPEAPLKARRDEVRSMVQEQLFFLEDPPLAIVSAKEGSGLDSIFSAIEKLQQACRRIPGTGELNRILQRAMLTNPPPTVRANGRSLKLYYATVALNEKYMRLPVPTYVLFVNDKRLLTDNYAQYLRSTIRKHTGVAGVPIVLSPRSRVRSSS